MNRLVPARVGSNCVNEIVPVNRIGPNMNRIVHVNKIVPVNRIVPVQMLNIYCHCYFHILVALDFDL